MTQQTPLSSAEADARETMNSIQQSVDRTADYLQYMSAKCDVNDKKLEAIEANMVRITECITEISMRFKELSEVVLLEAQTRMKAAQKTAGKVGLVLG